MKTQEDKLQYWKQYYLKHRDHKLKAAKDRGYKGRTRTLQQRIKSTLRERLRSSVRRGTKSGSAIQDLGCSVEELKLWLESQFQPGMTWDNWGTYWSIDHIVPLSRVDLTNHNSVKKVCHWFNLQPLTVAENIKKRNHI